MVTIQDIWNLRMLRRERVHWYLCYMIPKLSTSSSHWHGGYIHNQSQTVSRIVCKFFPSSGNFPCFGHVLQKFSSFWNVMCKFFRFPERVWEFFWFSRTCSGIFPVSRTCSGIFPVSKMNSGKIPIFQNGTMSEYVLEMETGIPVSGCIFPYHSVFIMETLIRNTGIPICSVRSKKYILTMSIQ